MVETEQREQVVHLKVSSRYARLALLVLCLAAMLGPQVRMLQAQGAVERQPLFQGVTYTRYEEAALRPVVIHVVTVDLTAPGVSLFVTPGDPSAAFQVSAQTTGHFLALHGLQVAINASFFNVKVTGTLADRFYTVGEPLQVIGEAVSDGVRYALPRAGFNTLFVGRDGTVTINQRPAEVIQAISGGRMLLLQGAVVTEGRAAEPRTAVALDEAGQTLYLVVVDGRQEGYSEGLTHPELARFIRELGGWIALNMDGGGSSTLVVQDGEGAPEVLNRPIGNFVPGRQRPVATHLGVRALPLETE